MATDGDHMRSGYRSSNLHESTPFLNVVVSESQRAFELREIGQQQDNDNDDVSRVSHDSDSIASVNSETGFHVSNNERKPGWSTRLLEIFVPGGLKSVGFWPRSARVWGKSRHHKSRQGRRTPLRPFKFLRRLTFYLLVFLGIIQLTTLTLGFTTAFFPETFDHAYKIWHDREGLPPSGRWATDYTADIPPVACHSHNDYWRRVPLISAIKAGCTGVEADVWVFPDDHDREDLYVGHDESALTSNRTFTGLYVDPLLEILDGQNPITEFQPSLREPRNGVFDTDPAQSLVLLVDFKTDYRDLWSVVSMRLRPLWEKGYLTYFNGSHLVPGPVTVVVTGNVPFEYVVINREFRDMLFDAPLDMLALLAGSRDLAAGEYDPSKEEEYLSRIKLSSSSSSSSSSNDTTTTPRRDQEQNQGQGHTGHTPTDPAVFSRFNSYYASVDFQASIGWPRPYLSSQQRDKIASQIAGAHAVGLKVRYWNVPSWPIGLRNYLWRELVKMGVDYLNVDDLNTATKGDWRDGQSVWAWSLWGGRDW